MVNDMSEHEHAATDYTVVRDEEPAELVGNIVERDLEARNTAKGLRIAADTSLTSSSTVVKLSAIATNSRSCAAKWCIMSGSVLFSRSWVELVGEADDTPLSWPRPAEARSLVKHPPPLAGVWF